MARRLTTNAQIDAFIAKVQTEAMHHAPWVAHVIQPLADAVRARLRLGAKGHDVSVYERNGQIARTCWVKVGGARWCFSYDYAGKKIELRQDSTQGPVVFQFDNATSEAAITRQAQRL
jgi:hypothetical protein